MTRLRSTMLGALALLLASSSARAQEAHEGEPGSLRVYGGLFLGFGGELELETSGQGPFGLRVSGSTEDDLATTVGGQLGVDYVLHRYFALGAEFRLGALNTERGQDDDVDRSKVFDIDLKPRVRYALSRVPLELYLTVPVGLTIARLSDDLTDFGLIEIDLDEKVGWNLGVGAGVTYFIVPRFGVNLEPLWLMHWFTVEGPGNVQIDFKARQFSLLLNLVLAF